MNAKAQFPTIPTIPTFAEVADKKTRRKPLTALDSFVRRFDQGGDQSAELAVALQCVLVEAKAGAATAADGGPSQDAQTWSGYVASMVQAYLQSEPPADQREAAIAGIVARRLWALPDRAQRQAEQEGTEQSLGLYAVQADAIRDVMDKHAPETTGNLQTRLAQVFERQAGQEPDHPAPETCQLVGIQADGTERVLGCIPVPARMKFKEIVRGYFSGDPDDEDSDAAMALFAYDELTAWHKEQARAQAVQRQCLMCHGTGQHPMILAIPAGVEPPVPRMVDCQQCKAR